MLDIEKHAESIRNLIDGEVRVYELMREHTSFRIGGPADIFALPESIEHIRQIISYARANEIPCHVIGSGSNLLVSDDGIRGITVRIGRGMSDVEFDDSEIKAQSGISLSGLSRIAAGHGLSGLEYGIGIPGTLGGAIVMNAGSHGQDIGQVVSSVKILNAEEELAEIENADSDFGYRNSRFRHSGEIVLEARLQLQRGHEAAIKEKMRELMSRRRRMTPLNYPSAGSIFKNPEGDSAGRLIDQAGCKGMRKGDAQVSDLHANWIVNPGQAKASDVLELISCIQNAVQRKFGIQLELELSVLS
ncbi:UDP-N-acetylmuramate dehydrogenase [Candidatus Poribacteria bacterium]